MSAQKLGQLPKIFNSFFAVCNWYFVKVKNDQIIVLEIMKYKHQVFFNLSSHDNCGAGLESVMSILLSRV